MTLLNKEESRHAKEKMIGASNKPTFLKPINKGVKFISKKVLVDSR